MEKYKIKGQFVKGVPVGKWSYFTENGEPDYEVEFTMEDFKFHFTNPNNPNFTVNTGTANFNILLDRWDDIAFELKGEYLDNKRSGNWKYLQGGKTVISETYKNGSFKRGYVKAEMGQMKTESIFLDASFFAPPNIAQVRKLYFDATETPNFYPFIEIGGI